MANKNLMLRQLFEKESSTYTYLLADKNTKEAIIIDPVRETMQRDLKLVEELGLKLLYILDTHIHADHITSSYHLSDITSARIVLGKNTSLDKADILLDEDEVLKFGDFEIKAILTPGHTNGCTTYNISNMLFTGDTLLIRSVGRTDFQQGDGAKLYDSIMKLYAFDDETIIYPGHNYDGILSSTIGEEKKFNNFIKSNTSKEEFVNAMNKRELPLPKKIDIAVPSNMILGEKVING